MPPRNLKRKQRHHSEPPLSRPSIDSETESGDELEGEITTERGGADSWKQGLQNANASIVSKARAALDSHLRSTSSIMHTGSSKRGRTTAVATNTTAAAAAAAATTTTTTTTSTAVSFPLTPTSAAGEAAPSSAVTAPAAAVARSTNHRSVVVVVVEDKMDEDEATAQTHPHHPPPDSNNNNDNEKSDDDGPSSTHSYSHHHHHHRHHRHHHHHSRGHPNGSTASSVSAVPRTMSHRIENQLIRPRSHFQDQQHFHEAHYYSAHPSPPPIATLTHSPSLSSDRSSVNSPAPTVLPPLNHHPSQFQAQPYRYTANSGAQPGVYHHSQYYPSTVSPPEVFTTPAQTYGHAYGGGYAPPPPTHVPFHHTADMSMSPSQYSTVNPYATTGSLYGPGGHAAGGGSGGFQPVYTDDASTKLSDRVRRRCFNCCTTDTSTWRRSSLNPGKVLCNKCGLFERTHSRPRPDQFPHKRAPLQIPAQNAVHDGLVHQHQQQQQNNNSSSNNNNTTQSSQSTHSSSGSPHNLPPTTGHPSLGATYSHPSALPQIQEWLRPESNSASGAAGATGAGANPPSASSSGQSSRAHSASSAGENNRHHPYTSSSIPASGAGTASVTATASATAATASGVAGEMRSPQDHNARFAKRSGSVNSDLAVTPPPSSRVGAAQNLTPSPSPPPARGEGTTSTHESSPRVAQSASSGVAAIESGN